MVDLPRLALSVRQPWAWTIVAGNMPSPTDQVVINMVTCSCATDEAET